MIKRFLIYTPLVTFLLVAGYLHTYPHYFWQFIHPAYSLAAKQVYSCTNKSPAWMLEALLHSVDVHAATSSQIAYIAPEGKLYHCELGFTGRQFLERVSSDDHYRLASLTKVVTYDLVARLVARNALNWNDLLVHSIQGIGSLRDGRVGAIRIAHLVDHLSGFGRTQFSREEMIGNKDPWCKSKLSHLGKAQLLNQPGEDYHYANLNYCLLSAIIEQSTGQRFEDFMEKEYGLAGKGLEFSTSDYGQNEVRYSFTFDDYFNSNSRYLNNYNSLAAAAGLSSSAKKFASFLHEILADVRVPLSQEIFEDGASSRCAKTTGCRLYGMNYFRFNKGGVGMLFHEGYIDGSASIAIKDHHGGVVVLTKNSRNIRTVSNEDQLPMWFHQKLTQYYLHK